MTGRIAVRRLGSLPSVKLPGRLSADPLADVTQDRMSVRYVTLPPGQPRTPHLHPHSPEFFVVLEGHGVVWWQGERYPVGQGDTVFVPQGTAHATIPSGDVPMRLLCFFPDPDLGGNLVELDQTVDQQVQDLDARQSSATATHDDTSEGDVGAPGGSR